MSDNQIQDIQEILKDTDIKEIISELKRESAMRNTVYPKLIANGRLSRADADRQWSRLNKAIQILLLIVPDLEKQKSLF